MMMTIQRTYDDSTQSGNRLCLTFPPLLPIHIRTCDDRAWPSADFCERKLFQYPAEMLGADHRIGRLAYCWLQISRDRIRENNADGLHRARFQRRDRPTLPSELTALISSKTLSNPGFSNRLTSLSMNNTSSTRFFNACSLYRGGSGPIR